MGTLYIVSTPIGNIDDITIRAIKVLSSVNIIFAEDTRVTKKLLKLLNINTDNKSFISNYEFNEKKKVRDAISYLREGNDIALVTDAGTPLISDPGFPLVRELRNNYLRNDENGNIKIEIIPGPSSVITALAGSGFPTDKFTFLGYFPRKPSQKKTVLKNIRKSFNHIHSTYIFFESGYRLLATLNMINEILPQSRICLARELTKMHESFEIGFPKDLIMMITQNKLNLKGEIVLLISLKKD